MNGEFVKRLACECDRPGVPHNINSAASPGMVKAAVLDAMRGLSGVTGISVESSDFIGQVEYFGWVARIGHWQ
jgi:hypothetical protein